jgi:hypothetical protein
LGGLPREALWHRAIRYKSANRTFKHTSGYSLLSLAGNATDHEMFYTSMQITDYHLEGFSYFYN